jgi:hypothetical protein
MSVTFPYEVAARALVHNKSELGLLFIRERG